MADSHIDPTRKLKEENVLAGLRQVLDPDLHKDIVTLGMVQDLKIDSNNDVSFKIVLTTPACPMKAKIEKEAREALLSLPFVGKIEIKMDAIVRGMQTANPGGSSPGANWIKGVSNIIAVSSGKGGVGKSTVATNLAVGLSLEGARVGLMDADIYGPNIPTMMGSTEQPKIIEDPERGEIFIPPVSHGIKVISMGFLLSKDQPVIWRGPMLHSVVNQFCHKVNWGDLDYLIIDMPPGTGDVQLSLAQLVPVTGAILVTTPQEISMQDVRKAYYMFEKVRIPILGIVENMSYFECPNCTSRHSLFGTNGGKILAKTFGLDLLAQIPIALNIQKSGDEGVPIVLQENATGIAHVISQFRDLARKTAQRISVLTHEARDPTQFVQIGKF